MAVNQRKAGAVLSYVSLAVNAAVAFAYVPILLSSLSVSEYGVYELIGSMIAYLGVMDMGLSTTLSRYFVYINETQGEEGLERLLSVSFKVYVVLTLIALAVCGCLYLGLDPLFGASFTVEELGLAREMMALVALNCVIVLPGNWFLAIVNANEDFVFARSVSIVKYLLQVVSVLLVLNWHAGAMGVLACQVAANAIAVLSYVVRARQLTEVRVRLLVWDKVLVSSLFTFSFFILLNMVFDQVFWKTGQVVLGAVCDAAAVAVYGIACKIITAAYMQASVGLTSVFLPKLTLISARTREMGQINDLFVRIGRLQAILVWGICGGFVVLGQEFIYLWAGPDFGEAYTATVILMIGLSISLVQNLGLSVLQAKNQMAFRAAVYTLLAVLDVVISIPVAATFGVTGCAVVAAVLLLLGTGPIMNWYYRSRVGIDVARFFRAVLPLLAPVVITSAAVWVASCAVALPYSWGDLVAKACLFALVYLVVLWALFLNEYEKGLVRGVARKISRKKAG